MFSWLDGWTSAWPSPPAKHERKGQVVDEEEHTSSLVSQRAAGARNLFLLLPEDTLSNITVSLLMIDAKGSRWGRACVDARASFLSASSLLARQGIAWWTGSGVPLTCPAIPEPGFSLSVDEGVLSRLVKGLNYKDIDLINEGWLTNFSIDAIFLASGVPLLREGYLLQPVAGALVVSAALAGIVGTQMGIGTLPITFTFPCFWSRKGVHQSIADAAVIFAPVNVGGNHWIAVRISKKHQLCEVFNSTKTPGNDCHIPQLCILLKILDGAGVPGAQNYRTVFYNSPQAWRQTDGSSCGIFCALIITSLVQGSRVHVKQKDMKMWRKHLHGMVTKSAEALHSS